MSRFSAILPNKKQISWGFDRPLGTYYLIEFKSRGEWLFNISSHNSIKPHPDTPDKMDYDKEEILELMQRYDDAIPEEHKIAIILDLPF